MIDRAKPGERSEPDWRDPDKAAAKVAGNHRKFESFVWHDRPDDDEDWAIFNHANRDSDHLEQSNWEAMVAELGEHLEKDEPDIRVEHAGHWAVGWVDGFAIRVRRGSRATAAFEAYCSIRERLEDYPVLDEEDLSRREYEEALERIEEEGREFVSCDAPNDWTSEIYRDLDDPREGFSENEVKAALFRQGWLADEFVYVLSLDGEERERFGNEAEAKTRHESYRRKYLGRVATLTSGGEPVETDWTLA